MASKDQNGQANPPSPPCTDIDGHQTKHIEEPKFLPSWDDSNLLCASPGDASQFLKRSKRRKSDKPPTFRSWIVDHQIGISLNLLALLFLAHLSFPRARRRTRSFFQLSYHHPDTNLYHQGPADFLYVATWIVVFTGLRAAVMTYILLPYAGWAGLKKAKTRVRFAEQAWLLLYYTVFWSIGMYLWGTSKYFFNLRELWTDFPARYMTGLMKWYYLAQFAFWLQQIVVVNIEERRKDHWQMFTHHIVTCCLILISLGYNQMRTGNVILCLMDAVDLTFPAAKMLKYTGHQTLCDIFFGIFMLTWIVARHILYMLVVRSIWVHVPQVMVFGTYDSSSGALLSTDYNNNILSNLFQPFLDPGGDVHYNPNMKWAFLIPLLVLQGITIMWFGMICRVAWSVLKGAPADDSRSDDEGEAEVDELVESEDIQTQHKATEQRAIEAAIETGPVAAAPVSLKPIEIEAPQEEYVGVEALNLRRRTPNKYPQKSRKSGSSPNPLGAAFAGHSDRKELLGRIGCDKPSGD